MNHNTAYYYKVAVGPDPIAREFSKEVSVTTPPRPSPPTHVTARARGSDTITLNWIYPSDPDKDEIEHFNIHCKTADSEYQLVGKSRTNSYDYRAKSSTQYFFRVSAVQPSGLHGERSDEQSATTPPPPPEVQGLNPVAIGSNTVIIRWEAQPDVVYNIYRDNQLIGTSTIPSYVDTPLPSSTRFTYYVRAVDPSGAVGE